MKTITAFVPTNPGDAPFTEFLPTASTNRRFKT
jgi:hypothetical protein